MAHLSLHLNACQLRLNHTSRPSQKCIIFLVSFSMKEKKGRKSRPQTVYRLSRLTDLADKLEIIQVHYDEMPPDRLKWAADYRAEVYAALPMRKPGQYPRITLTEHIGVSTRTGQTYDKRANLKVTPNFSRKELSSQELVNLPDRTPKDRKYNVWLEDEQGRRYPPDRRGTERIASNGGGKVYRVQQLPNTYQPGKQDNHKQ